jgi:hypothetical protein
MTDFAWTPGAGAYKHYPPYVNLTGNRLTVRGVEFQDGEHWQMGPTVNIDLPDEALTCLIEALSTRPLQVPTPEVIEALTEAHRWFRDREQSIRNRYEQTGCEVNLRRTLEAEVSELGELITKIDVAMQKATPSAASEEAERPYGPKWAEYAAPGDNQEDRWLLRFADPDCREAMFSGPDAEREAWDAWNRYAPGFNCWLFRLAALAPAQKASNQ